MEGNDGNDTVDGGSGDNTLMSGTGTDQLSDFSSENVFMGSVEDLDGDLIQQMDDDDQTQITGLTAAGSFVTTNIDEDNDGRVDSSVEVDHLFGYSLASSVDGAGNTEIYIEGGLLNDTLIGSSGDDSINGYLRDDLIMPSTGADMVDGFKANDPLQGIDAGNEIQISGLTSASMVTVDDHSI